MAIAALAVTFGACGGDDGCDLEARSRALGGSGLLDCGLAQSGDTSTVDRCAVTAHQSRSTFRAIYEGEDGELQALIHAAGDRYLLLRETASGLERVDCASARVTEQDGRRFVECVEPSEPVAECG